MSHSTSITLYLVRHGQTEYNATGRIQGWLDVPLDEIGLAQSLLVGKRFAGKKLAAVYSSPLLRAAVTAQAIAKTCSIDLQDVKMDDRLREYNMGKWQGMTGDEIVATMPGVRWDIPERPIPDGENAQQMHERVSGFLHDVLAWHKPGDVVVAVSHGGTLGAVVGTMLGLPVVRRQPFSFGNTAITKTVYEHGQWHIRTLNDRCHLRPEE